MRLRSERIVTPAGVVAGDVVVSGGVVAGVMSGVGAGAGACDVDVGRRWVVPGFIDLHVHGGGGARFDGGSVEEVRAAAAFHARHGTTALLATLVSAPVELLVGGVEAARAAVSAADPARAASPPPDPPYAGARVLGVHVEGPFVCLAAAGAMDPDTFLAPSADVARRLLAAGGGGAVRMMTVAPELPGALEVIDELVGAGVVVSLGHSRASYEQAVAAVRAGGRSVTHLFNAMGPFHHREPGLIGAGLDCGELSCELICDGLHVSAAAMRVALAAKGVGGVRLVTDAISAAGMPDGSYRLGSVPVVVRGGRAVVADRGGAVGADWERAMVREGGDVLAGSTLTMDRAVAGAVRWLGVGVPEAVAMASTNPARLLGLGDRLGALAPGYLADLVVLDDDLRACGTMVGGEWVVAPD